MRSKREIALRTMVVVAFVVFAPVVAAVQTEPIDYTAYTLELENGLVTVADLELPPEFIRRVADRSLRADFRRRHREQPAPNAAVRRPAPPRRPVEPEALGIEIVLPAPSAARPSPWSQMPEVVPPLRGFRAAILEDGSPWPFRPEPASVDPAKYVAERLARDKLIRTTLFVLASAGLPSNDSTTLDDQFLRSVGIPVDLLDYFVVGREPARERIQRWRAAGADASEIDEIVGAARFSFRPSCPGFVATGDDGAEPVGGLRLQLPSNRFVRGPGDGSTLDVFRQLATMSGRGALCVSILDRRVDGLLRQMREWSLPEKPGITIVAAPARVSQWAQDNAKPGLAPRADDPSRLEPVLLLPRFASRNEQMTKFVAADTMVLGTLGGRAGREVSSPLLFQGGNLLMVHDSATGRRTLLVGEAEIHRNGALGLRDDEVVAAFAAEFGADHCVVLPAVSFHIDMEMTVRSAPTGPIVCVGDDLAAASILLDAAVTAMTQARVIDPSVARTLHESLGKDDRRTAAAVLRRLFHAAADGDGGIDALDDGIGRSCRIEEIAPNRRRVLLALDLLTASLPPSDRPAEPPIAEAESLYLASLSRRLEDRAEFRSILAGLGWPVVLVPNLGDEEAGANSLNLLHLRRKSLLPVIGGFLDPLDTAAARVYAEAFGSGIEIVPMATSAIQAMYGGLHCTIGVISAAPIPLDTPSISDRDH